MIRFFGILIVTVLAIRMELWAVPVTELVFSPDGTQLLSNGFKQIDRRSPDTGEIIGSWKCDLPRIGGIAFSGKGDRIAIGGGVVGESGSVVILEAASGRPLMAFGEFSDVVTSIAFSADDKTLLAGSADHFAQVWQLGTNAAKHSTLKGHSGPILSVACSPSGKTWLTASADRSLKVWDARSGELIRTLSHHTEAVHAIGFRPGESSKMEGKVFCASVADDRTVRIWQPEIGRMVRIIRGHQAPPLALGFAPDGSSLFSAGQEGTVRRIDAESDTILESWTVTKEWIYALAVRPDGRKLALGDWAGQVWMIDSKLRK